MSRSISYCALILAYIATLFYLVAMCTPWWYTKYYPSDENTSEDQFYDNNPSLDQHNGLFDRTNCFIDGSCITHHTIYKNNSTLQWVYTTVLVLMIVGWIPWLIFVHLLHARVNKNRTPMKGRRLLMIITALLTMAIILTAIIVFAAGMTQSNGVYNQGGLYGHLPVQNNGLFTGSNSNFNGNNKRSIEGPMAEMLLNKRTGGSGASGPIGGSGASPSGGSGASGPIGGSGASGPSGGSGASGPSVSTGPSSSNAPSSSAPVVITPVPSTSEAPSTSTSDAPSSTVQTSDSTSSTATGIVVVTGTSEETSSSSTANTDTTSATGGDNVNNGDDGVPFGYTGMNPSTGMIPPFAFGTLPYGGSGISLLGAGIPVVKNLNASSIVGNLGYKYGASSAWYGALLALPFILGALILGLCVAPVGRVVTQTHAPVTRSVVAAPAVIPAPAFVAPAIPAPAAPVAHSVAQVGPAIQHAPVAFANPGAASVGAPTMYGASTIAPMAAAPVFGAAPAALRDNTPLTRRVTNVYHDNN